MPNFFQQFSIEALCTAILETEADLNIFHFMWINNLLAKLKTNLGCVYHVFGFNKYASRWLIHVPNCFRRRFDLKPFRKYLIPATIVTNPQSDARLCSAEASC